MQTKQCKKCNEALPATLEFYRKQTNGKYGLGSVCKACAKIIAKAYRSTDTYKKRAAEAAKKWRKNNHDRAIELSRKTYYKHRERFNKEKKEKYLTDPNYKAKVIAREQRYKASGRRYEIQSKPDQREKARIRSQKRRKNPDTKHQDAIRMKEYRQKNSIRLQQLDTERRINLTPAYVAQLLGINVSELTPEIHETKKLIVQIKREISNSHIKTH